MVKFGVPFVPSSSSSDPEREMLEFVKKTTEEFEKEKDDIYETLIRDGFLTEAYRTNVCDGEVSWKWNVTNAIMFGENAMISKTCFDKEENAIRMIDFTGGKGYHCVFERAGMNDDYEIHIVKGWKKFAEDKKLQEGDVILFSMVPLSDMMHVDLLNRGCCS